MSGPKALVDWIAEYVAYRRSLGFRLTGEAGQLRRFARYVEATGHTGPLTVGVCLRWIQQAGSPNSRHRRFATVRAFCKYVALFEPRTETPSRAPGEFKCRRPVPHIYSPGEVTELLRACEVLRPVDGLRPRTYRTLFGMLAATGLRVSEALHLQRRDVDLDRGVLTVRDTKFRKSRIVPVHPSTRDALRQYALVRDRYCPAPHAAAFFLSESGSALAYPTVRGTFQMLRRRLGWKADGDRKLPRIQDLRHTFCCRRILGWYEAGVDVAQALPVLSTYLGHGKVTDTYWYLTGIPELMAITARRFEQFAHEEGR